VQPFGYVFEAPPKFFLMRGADYTRRMIGVGKLGRNINLWAAAIVRPVHAFGDPFQMRLKLPSRAVLVELGDFIPAQPKILVFAAKERRNEIVFGAEIPIEACLCDTGFFDNKVYANGMYAAAIEKRGRRRKDTLSHFGGALGCALIRFRHGTASHVSISRPFPTIATFDSLQTCL
jgi:hypothetical protein